MLLNDIILDYKNVLEKLRSCDSYFSLCFRMSFDFQQDIFDIIGEYYDKKINSKTPPPNIETNLILSIDSLYSAMYDSVVQLIEQSYEFYNILTDLQPYDYKNKAFEETMERFYETAEQIRKLSIDIIKGQNHGMKAKNLLPKLVNLIRELLYQHNNIEQFLMQLIEAENALIEDIPEYDAEESNYNRIEFYSLKPSTDFDCISKDINNLAQFMTRFEMAMNDEHSSNKIYTQRIESGSLKIVFGSYSIQLSGITDIIKTICDGIKSFRLASIDKKLLNEQVRSAALDNDEKELAIINLKLDTIARIMGVSLEDPVNSEELQQICLPILRYLVSNPRGKVGEYEYNLDDDMKLIERLNSSKKTTLNA